MSKHTHTQVATANRNHDRNFRESKKHLANQNIINLIDDYLEIEKKNYKIRVNIKLDIILKKIRARLNAHFNKVPRSSFIAI